MLPGSVMPLHVFEPRYRALATDVNAMEDPEFGVTLIERGREVGGGDQRADVGIVARILQAEEFPDGRWGIVTIGTRRIGIDDWLADDPYPKALVHDWPDEDISLSWSAVQPLRDELDRVLAAARLLAPDRIVDPPSDDADDPAVVGWQLIRAAQLGAHDELRLLQQPGWHGRLALAIELARDRADLLEALAHRDQ